jgi:hypothetical protein
MSATYLKKTCNQNMSASALKKKEKKQKSSTNSGMGCYTAFKKNPTQKSCLIPQL